MENVHLTICLSLSASDLTDKGYPKWLAVEESTGLFALAEDRESALSRLKETVTHTLGFLTNQRGVKSLRSYLDAHGVPYVEVMDVPRIENVVLNVLHEREKSRLVYASG